MAQSFVLTDRMRKSSDMGYRDNENVDISVMITFYNQVEYVEQTIKSVLSQKTDLKYELILGDDGSNDGTYELLSIWKEKYPDKIVVLRMPREKDKKYEPIIRVSNNRYNMLKYARGKYVTYLDGDDYYTDDNKLQKQYDLLEAHPECVACGHNITMLWEKTGQTKMLGLNFKKTIVINNKDYWRYFYLHTDTLLFRNVFKASVEQIEADIFDDNIITLYFIKNGNIVFIPEQMAVYRQLEGSSWNKRSEYERLMINLNDFEDEKRVAPQLKKQSQMRHISEMIKYYNLSGTKKDFRYVLLKMKDKLNYIVGRFVVLKYKFL